MNNEEHLNQEMVRAYLLNLQQPKMKAYQNIRLSQNIFQKFFQDETKENVENIIEKALENYFKNI